MFLLVLRCSGASGLFLGSRDCFGPSYLKLLHASSGIYQFFFAGIERVALVADFNLNLGFG